MIDKSGRRACVWHSYVWGRKRTVYGSGASVGTEAEREGWTVRITVPRMYRYGTAEARHHPLKKVHIVRDVVVARKGKEEERLTWWLCGAQTFAASLRKDPPTMVCAKCLLVETGRSLSRFPRG